jgi:hypothetical protein
MNLSVALLFRLWQMALPQRNACAQQLPHVSSNRDKYGTEGSTGATSRAAFEDVDRFRASAGGHQC